MKNNFNRLKFVEKLCNKPTSLSVCLILLSVLFKISFIVYPFWGMEYEDAFVYTDASRYLLYNYDWTIDSFQTKICAYGSLAECYQYSTYSGHYMFFPLVLFIVHKVFGYFIYNTFITNFFVSLLTLVFFIKSLNILGVKQKVTFFTSLILITTPFLNLFNTSGLAETSSSCFIILSIYFFLKSFDRAFNFKEKDFWIFVLMFVCSFLVKRENLILILLPITSYLHVLTSNSKKHISSSVLLLIAILSILGIAYNYIAGIHEMEIRESKDINAAMFSIANFRVMFPMFIHSFISIKYFGIAGIIFLLSTIIAFLNSVEFKIKLIIVISWGYILLYSSHYRSYYQVHLGNIDVFETLRYSSNFFPVASIGFVSIVNSLEKFRVNGLIRTMASILTFCIVGVLLFLNIDLRKKMNALEFKERILPVIETLKHTSNNDYVLTDLPMIFHIYSSDKKNIIDINSITEEKFSSLINSSPKSQVYLLKNSTKLNYKLSFLKNIDHDPYLVKIIKLSNGYQLIKTVNKVDSCYLGK